MGIPYYFYKLTQKYKNIVSNTKPDNVSTYCIDFNGIIHNVAHNFIYKEANNIEEKIIDEVWKKIEYYIETYKAEKYIICADGVAPAAKIIQQRKRRYLSVYRNTIDSQYSDKPLWDTNAITPGTNFMNKLNVFIEKKIRYSTSNIELVYSGSDKVGEGEHKIFHMLKLHNNDSNIIINGLDADLIILSMISHINNIYLMRESIDKDTGCIVYKYLNVNNLKHAILSEINDYWNIDHNEYDSKDLIESYCTMTTILGNDFIPHLLTIDLKTDGIDKLISATKIAIKDNGLLVENNKINYETLKDILKYLSLKEDEELHNICGKYINKKVLSDSKLPSEFYAIKNKDKLVNIIYNNPNSWHKEYYKLIFDNNITIDSSVILNSCENYIKGIYWVYNYYKGVDIDKEWYYPYNYPPSLKDIYNYSTAYSEPIFTPNSSYICPNIQLLIVLPRESSNLLKPKYKKYMENIYSGLFHMYPKKYKITTFLKTHLWECCPNLPLININYIKRVIELDR